MNVGASNSDPELVELTDLLDLFFDDHRELGTFVETSAEQMPDNSKKLLAHNHHMTVTVEEHHDCPVNVKVLETRYDQNRYSRKILLTRSDNDAVVQYGIVRLNVDVLTENVRTEIESEKIPLGRVLINHNVLREVRLLKLYQIECGPVLAEAFGYSRDQTCFGRTALIYCDGSPAIELLEIVSH